MRSLVLITALVVMVVAANADSFVERFDPFAVITAGNFTPVPDHGRAALKQHRYHWYELSDAQDQKLRAVLKDFKTKRPILILSATADSLGLAEDFDSAFKDAGLKSSIDRPMDTVDGLHCTSPELANLITAATGIKMVIDDDENRPDGALVLNFGRKQ
jgi:hypothetical protein